MFIYTHLYTIITMLNIPLAITVIFLERRNIGVTWAWLMVLLFLPVVGFAVYLLFGQNLSKQKLYNINRRSRIMMAALIENQRKDFRENHITFTDPAMADYRGMIFMNLSSGYALYSQNNSVDIFTNGTDKFECLFKEIEQARESIHMMYYIVQNDALARRMAEALTRKAKEGVQVRFLYDDIGSYHLPRHFFDELKQAGGQVSAFFPSKIPYLNFRVNYRNHRKLVIIDGVIGYIGGFNIGDEYLGIDQRFGFWRDTHLRLIGNSVQQMQSQFLLDWNLASPYIVTGSEPGMFKEAEACGTVGIQIVSSGPNQTLEQIKNAYIKMINSARKSIYIQTPYFIPDESLLDALKMAVLSGIDVRMMIPSKPDHKMVYLASFSYLGDLMEQGMKCYLYEKGFMHAKTIVVDGNIASVGTANVDIRSFKLNFEVNAVIYDTGTATRLKEIFEADMLDSRELTYEEYKKRPLFQRFKESCTRLLSPIL
ncbi:cardiolipin synthase [Paenibacillus sepulcri]|uniref:Cardiolipin synthase n=1 Tax=Paenibacillus sepulcri TaxID=359917 RepID=A0ABS7C137_9BACL|nr:cardiolipin synthase [Paenibacillus sepulcri]